jgi:Ca2+-binding RTX toxin-like protein
LGDDVVLGYAGPDKIRSGNDNDQQYGGRGNDVIYSEVASGIWSIVAEAQTRPMWTPRTGWLAVKGRGEG